MDNPKYKENKKNGGIIPAVYDARTLLVPIKCGECIECRKDKAREWQVRLLEDIKHNKNGKFVALTFSNEEYAILHEELSAKGYKGYDLDNAIATRAVRLYLENHRKKYKKSLRHWFITELGHEGTENIHIHGIIWSELSIHEATEKWKYGFVWKGKGNKLENYVNEKTINYIIKYVHKTDEKHKTYKPIVLTSAGIGADYVKTFNASRNKYNGENTKEYYITRQGHKMKMPIYWKNKLYTDREKEDLWLDKLDKEERYVLGEKISVKETYNVYWEARKSAREKSARLGYGNDKINYDQEEYEKKLRELKQQERLRKQP